MLRCAAAKRWLSARKRAAPQAATAPPISGTF